jgi:hypothetical protein
MRKLFKGGNYSRKYGIHFFKPMKSQYSISTNQKTADPSKLNQPTNNLFVTSKRKPIHEFKVLHKSQRVFLKVSRSRNKIVEPELLPKNELRISVLEVYYFKVNTKREYVLFCKKIDSLLY